MQLVTINPEKVTHLHNLSFSFCLVLSVNKQNCLTLNRMYAVDEVQPVYVLMIDVWKNENVVSFFISCYDSSIQFNKSKLMRKDYIQK